MITNHAITQIEDACDVFTEIFKSFYSHDRLDSQLEVEVQGYFDRLKDNLFVIFEYPYVDKVYRDSYYTYFSSKNATYPRDCIRAIYFEEEIKLEDFRNPEKFDELQKLVKGYTVFRPIVPHVVGRSLISPQVLKNNGFITCQVKQNIMVNGVKLDVQGFPHSSQDTESISCAETATWCLMEYFGFKYAEYKPVLPSKIINTLSIHTNERLLPSEGLSKGEQSYVLKQFGFGTRIYFNDSFDDDDLYRLISTYVSSGIPVNIGLAYPAGGGGHALLICGHEAEFKIDLKKQKAVKKIKIDDNEFNLFDFSEFKKKYVFIDDNYPPYQLAPLEKPGEYSDDDEIKISSALVPLYPKIYLEAYNAHEMARELLSINSFSYGFKGDVTYRLYLTSSRSFKAHLITQSLLDPVIIDHLILTKMPKFIWVTELYNNEEFKLADGLILLDATEANVYGLDSFIFAGYPDRCVSKFENDYLNLPLKFDKFVYYKNNLK